jgi:hypothetical protein
MNGGYLGEQRLGRAGVRPMQFAAQKMTGRFFTRLTKKLEATSPTDMI